MTSHVGGARAVHGDRVAGRIVLVSADVAAVDETCSGDIDARHEGVEIVGPAVVGEVRTDDHRKGRFRRLSATGHVGIAGAVHGDSVGLIPSVAADVAAVDQARARGVHLGHEGVAAAVEREVGPDGCRKIVGPGFSGHVGVPVCVHRNGEARLFLAAADVAAVDHHRRIENERHRRVVGADVEAVGELARLLFHLGKGHRHLFPFPVDELIGEGRPVHDRTEWGGHDQLALGVHAQVFGAAAPEPYAGPIGTGRHDELVLEEVHAAGEDEVDARPQVVVDQPAAGADAGLPVGGFSPEVTENRFLGLLAAGNDIRTAVDEICFHGPAEGLVVLRAGDRPGHAP